MRKKVAVITGGNSSEYVIAVKSADTIIENLDKEKFEAFRLEIKGTDWFVQQNNQKYPVDKNDFSITIEDNKITFDIALIMIHGDPGEDGKLQGYLDMMEIPYTSSDVLASSATFSKHFTKKYLDGFGIKSAEWVVLHKSDLNIKDLEQKIGFPCFVKPNNAGSSFGVSKVDNHDQLEAAVHQALKEDDEVLVEKMIYGTEITCGVLRTSKRAYSFPVTEIVSKTGFFDYEAKYTVGKSEEIIPARIDDKIAKECQELSLKIYDIFRCKWFGRVDYIISNNELYMLEINTIPGMSKESIIPKMVRAAGLNLSQILTEIIEDVI